MTINLSDIPAIREQVENSFSSISSFVGMTIKEIDTFIRMISPYVEYFFSGKEGPDAFIGDVLNPSRRDLSNAINSATTIMSDDSHVHEKVFETIQHILPLRENVEKIVEMLEAIEIYSLNTLVISAKAGDEGLALATISTKMAKLSQEGNALSVSASEKMAKLSESLHSFTVMRDGIEGLNDNNLTIIHLSSEKLFVNLLGEFNRLSTEVLEEFEMIKSVNTAFKKITEKFQHHDLVRQGLEKIGFAGTLYGSDLGRKFCEHSGIETGLLQDIMDDLTVLKMDDIGRDLNTLQAEMRDAIDKASSALDIISGTIDTSHGEERPSDVLETLADNLERLKAQFQEYITEIIRDKEEMSVFLDDLSVSISGFASFFNGINNISHTFKTIILMTRIELARHDKLRQLLGGTLSDVSKIPDQINTILSRGMKQFADIIASMEGSKKLYKNHFLQQRRILEESTRLINNVSIQVFESKKYHDEFLGEIHRGVTTAKPVLSGSYAHLDGFLSLSSIFEYRKTGNGVDSRDTLHKKYGRELKLMSEYFSSDEFAGDYMSMMLASLASEFRDEIKQTGTIEFF